MPRILNVNLPKDKAISKSLTKIPGIGQGRAKLICAELGISFNSKLSTVSKDKLKVITDFIDNQYTIGSKLTRDKTLNIKRLIKISSYRGFRHVRGLPCRGQRTCSNSKTSRKFKLHI